MAPYLLIDGYNVIAPVAPPGRQSGRSGDSTWLQRERRQLLDRLADHLPAAIIDRTCVVFDSQRRSAKAGAHWRYRGIEVRFAVDHDEADDLIEEILQRHPHSKHVTVVSSDYRIQAAARRKRAAVYDSAKWLDELLDGRPMLRKLPRLRKAHTDDKTIGLTSDQKPSGPTTSPESGLAIPDEALHRWMEQYGGGEGKSGDTDDFPN